MTPPGAPPDDDGAARVLLEAAVARAEQDLQEAAGGRTLCRIDGSGGPTPFFVKRAEGARAALGDVRRALRRDPETGVRHAADAVLAHWLGDLAQWEGRGAAPWIAYCEGGCASVESLVVRLRESTGPPGGANTSAGEPAES